MSGRLQKDAIFGLLRLLRIDETRAQWSLTLWLQELWLVNISSAPVHRVGAVARKGLTGLVYNDNNKKLRTGVASYTDTVFLGETPHWIDLTGR